MCRALRGDHAKGLHWTRDVSQSAGTLARRCAGLRRWTAVPEADYRLPCHPTDFLPELTPARMPTLEALEASGSQSTYQLVKRLGRNSSNVRADVAKPLELGLAEKDPEVH